MNISLTALVYPCFGTHYFWVLGMGMGARPIPIPIPNDTQQVGYIPDTHTQVPSIFWVFRQKKALKRGLKVKKNI